jgi:hypothetical protein
VPFQGSGQTRQASLAQTMSAFTLEKPRPLGTRKRGFESTEFNGQTLCGQPFILKNRVKRLAAKVFKLKIHYF